MGRYSIVDKRKVLDKLYYELWMLYETYNLLLGLLLDTVAERNALLESFLIHARNLLYFLQDKGRNTDIKISKLGLLPISLILPPDNDIDQIDKYLAHLTDERIYKNKPNWTCDKIFNEIDVKFKIFLNQLNKININIYPTEEGRTKQDFDILLTIVNKT